MKKIFNNILNGSKKSLVYIILLISLLLLFRELNMVSGSDELIVNYIEGFVIAWVVITAITFLIDPKSK